MPHSHGVEFYEKQENNEAHQLSLTDCLPVCSARVTAVFFPVPHPGDEDLTLYSVNANPMNLNSSSSQPPWELQRSQKSAKIFIS